MTKKQIEIAARHLCKLRGVDADNDTWIVDERTLTSIKLKHWELAAKNIRDHLHITESIRVAFGDQLEITH